MRILLIGLLLMMPMAMIGCDEDDNGNPVVNREPAAPQGVYTITGDGEVTIYWNGPYESSIDYYVIYRSLEPVDNYVEIGRRDAEANPDLDLLIYHFTDQTPANGTTYFYAVSTVNTSGLESDLSAENAYDTPRPQGEVILRPIEIDSLVAAFNLETGTARPYVAGSALQDVYIDLFDGILYINAGNVNTDIQDMGFTSTFDGINVAPDSGWSELGYAEIIVGHSYVIWTADNHFAKMRVKSISPSGSIVFEWAYQTDTGNPELIAPLRMQRPVHGDNYLRKQLTTDSNVD